MVPILEYREHAGTLAQVAGLADRVYLLETGSLVRQGPADELLRDKALLESYLG